MTTNLLSVKETAPLLNMAEITLRRFIKAGKIGYKKIGSRFMFTPEQVQEYLQSVDVPIAGGKNE